MKSKYKEFAIHSRRLSSFGQKQSKLKQLNESSDHAYKEFINGAIHNLTYLLLDRGLLPDEIYR